MPIISLEVELVSLPPLHLDVMLKIPVSSAYADPTQIYLLLFTTAIPSFLTTIVIFNCMIILYHIVLIQERNLGIFNISGDQNRALSKRVAMQGIYFSGAYLLTYMFWYVYMVINTISDDQPEWIWILNSIFLPYQGIFGCIW